LGKNNSVGTNLTVADATKFLNTLSHNGYDVDKVYEYAKYFKLDFSHLHSARFVTNNSNWPGFHITQESGDPVNYFSAHWDRRSTAFYNWNSKDYPDRWFPVYMPGRVREQIDAASTYDNPYSAAQLRQQLKTQGIVPTKEP